MGLDLGRDLGTPRLSWRRLDLIISRLGEDSQLFRSRNTEHIGWDIQTHLLAAIVDLLGAANWQRSGKKTLKKPDPVKRPGRAVQGRKFGTTAMSREDADAWLAGAGFADAETELVK